jgi:hypothetical protein
MSSLTWKTFLLLALTLPSFTTTSIGCCPKQPPVQTVIRVPTSCLATVGPLPVMGQRRRGPDNELVPVDTRPEGCPDDMACFDVVGMVVLGRYIRETLRWMEQVEIACSVESTP